jgi:hypothetical protein
MRTVDIFSSFAENLVQDSHIQKYGYMLLTKGVPGVAKLNPWLVWVDAALSVIEASNSYFQYCAAKEVTEQLRVYNRTLEQILAQQLRIGELELETLHRERQGRLKEIERTLAACSVREHLTLQQVRDQLETLKRMHRLLQTEREQVGSFQQLIGLQVCLDTCIDATLTLILDITAA